MEKKEQRKAKVKICPINDKFDNANYNYRCLGVAIKKNTKYPPVIYNLKNNSVAVHPQNIDDYRTLLKAVEEAGFQYYLFNNPDVNFKKYVIRRLRIDTKTKDIEKELMDQGVIVHSISLRRRSSDKKLIPLFLVTVNDMYLEKITTL